MTEYLLEHLSSTLSKNGIVAYVWNAGEDRFSWTGDLTKFLGLEQEKYPVTNAELHQLINPQDVHERLSALKDVLGRNPDYDVATGFTSIYKIRQANGSFIEVEETAKLQEIDGKRMLCGHLKMRSSFNQSNANISFENVIPVMLDAGFNSYGRMALTRKIEEWFDTYKPEERSFGYLLTVGIDRMALFNEVMGPRYADEIIGKTGERLQQIVGEAGVVCRVEGDVYGLLFRQAVNFRIK